MVGLLPLQKRVDRRTHCRSVGIPTLDQLGQFFVDHLVEGFLCDSHAPSIGVPAPCRAINQPLAARYASSRSALPNPGVPVLRCDSFTKSSARSRARASGLLALMKIHCLRVSICALSA